MANIHSDTWLRAWSDYAGVSGSCTTAREAALRITELFLASVLEEIPKRVPAANKWWTVEPSLVAQTAFYCIHDTGGRVVPRAFGAVNNEDTDSEDDDFHKRVSGKSNRA